MRQRGFSFFGLILLVAMIAGIASVAIKIFPAWMDFRTVSEATHAVISQPRAGLQRNDQILEKIDRQLSVNNIEIKSLGKDAITLSRDDGSLVATIDYLVEKPVFERDSITITINMQFYKTHEVSLGE
ncbi:MAG: DUF4845 domain-containing protein [Gammaproteobacteria bacterium]